MRSESLEGRPVSSADRHDLQRFIDAQATTYDTALAEIRRGRKTSHWMWFGFPQIAGLGHSAMSQRFAIRSLAEARAYLAHPLLGPRLRECVGALQDLSDTTTERVFGSVDSAKLRSSLTQFSAAAPEELSFAAALTRWFGGVGDELTLRLLAQQG